LKALQNLGKRQNGMSMYILVCIDTMRAVYCTFSIGSALCRQTVCLKVLIQRKLDLTWHATKKFFGLQIILSKVYIKNNFSKTLAQI